MENYSYPATYPDSGNSSPRSREIDFENPPPWEDQAQPQSQNYKVKFMCSYGGKIQPRTHDNQLSYVGGETKILAVDRTIKFPAMIAKLSALCEAPDVSFKYQLPGEDLDALISVANDDDLEHMMHEYDRLFRGSAKPARMRLFLFPVTRSERDRFVESAPVTEPVGGGKPVSAAAVQNNVDFLFSLERGMHAPPPPVAPVVPKLQDPAPEPVAVPAEFPGRMNSSDRSIGSDHAVNPMELQRELQRLQIGSGSHDQGLNRRKSEDYMMGGGYSGEYYVQKVPEKAPPASVPVTMPPTGAPPAGYWPEKQLSGGGFPHGVSTAPAIPDQQVYMIPGAVYHPPPAQMVRPMTGQPGQGFYTMPSQQPVYNVVHHQQPQAQQVTMPPQQQPKMTGAYSSGGSSSGGGVGVGPDGGPYAQVAYDSAGRQVYYTTGGGMVAAPPPAYQGVPAVGGEVRTSQEGKVVVTKVTQGSV